MQQNNETTAESGELLQSVTETISPKRARLLHCRKLTLS